MIWLDWLIVAIVGYNLVTGLFSGFLRSLVNLIALVVAYLLTPVVKGPLAALLHGSAQVPDAVAIPLGAFLAWTLVYVIVSMLGMIFSKMVNMTPLAILDRIGGAAFGLFVSALLILLPLAAIQAIPFINSLPPLQQTLKASKVVTALQPAIGFTRATVGPAILDYWFKSSDQAKMKTGTPAAQPSPGATPGPVPAKPGAKPATAKPR